MSIEISNESEVAVDEAALHSLASFALDYVRVSSEAELAIMLVDVPAMEELHVQWMDEPGPTDVLSFPMDQLRPGTDDHITPAGVLGDIVLCPEVAIDQAKAAHHSVTEELQLLTTHGILHLLGFDHSTPTEEREMFGLQTEILVAYALETRNK